ncbi:MAG TPA: type IV toxin-antitoxin system AbiEi family antitoxin domain-containing protein, partial [Solirubrobacterales bacterium]|nr:type IV toxin-antitoxin system AbiEi family antitoxin domain-containing protein [Solirubrobacterales bacterium]
MLDEVRTPSHVALAELAERQHGVVTKRQLEALGFVRSTIPLWANEGRLHRVHRGVYAVGHMAISWEGRCLAAVLARPGAVASHKTAAWIYGLLRSRPGTIHLTAPTRQRAKRDFVVHFARLVPEDVRTMNGIPVTSPARTVLDLAPDESLRDLGRLLRRADDNELLDRRRFEALLSRAGGHPGRGKLAAALRAYKPEQAVLRSDLEKRFRDLVLAAGLLRPQTNVVVEGYELDAYWEAEGFAVELDVYATHGSPTSFEEDRKREDDLLLAGIELIRVTDVRLDREPRETIAHVAAHLARRRRAIRPR